MPQGEERLIGIVQEHWVKYVNPFLIISILLALSMLLFYLAGESAYHEENVSTSLFFAGLLFLLFAHHAFFHRILSEKLDQVIITSKRIIQLKTRLFLEDDIIEIPLDKVRAVRADKRGVLQNLLRYGSISLDANEAITRIPHPQRIAKEISMALEMK